MKIPDVIVVGSGPSGACAALACLDRGLRVQMVDVGNDDATYRDLIPDKSFEEIRRTDPQQHRYFLGDDREGIPTRRVQVGAQLTPPRQFVVRDTESLLPCESRDFFPMQSLALGGLGASWGAQAVAYSDDELVKLGLPPGEIRRNYSRVAGAIGISGDPGDDIGRESLNGIDRPQAPLDLDTGAAKLLACYRRLAPRLHLAGYRMGRTPLAVLSQDLGDRRANPYHDMDFWSDSRRSVFRPRYLVEALLKRPNFALATRRFVVRFAQTSHGTIEVATQDVAGRAHEPLVCRRLLIAAGAIGSARIVLRSLGARRAAGILCNRYTYVPVLHWRMLGRQSSARRHSLSQLFGIYDPDRACSSSVSMYFYSYGSLLLFKLVKEMPLPPWAGLLSARLLVNSLMIVGIHHPDTGEGRKSIELIGEEPNVRIRITYEESAERVVLQDRLQRGVLRILRQMGCQPLGQIDPGKAGSIHYAGTLPSGSAADHAWTGADGSLIGFPGVFIGDSAIWRFLPSKSPTLTMMANAMRVGDAVADSLRP